MINPVPASGGADRESDELARRNAPLGVRTFGRVVAASDYADFALTFAGIAKDYATNISDGQRKVVHLTIAGIDDVWIERTSDLYDNLRTALGENGNPNQPFEIEMRRLLLLAIGARVGVRPNCRWKELEPRIRARLYDQFGFGRRALAQGVRRAEIIAAIQSVPGVAYVDLDLLAGVDEGRADSPASLLKALDELKAKPAAQDIAVSPTFSKDGIQPAQLAYLDPKLPEMLILQELSYEHPS